jgi:3-oxoacyl-[acyl-carrier protein] reductase
MEPIIVVGCCGSIGQAITDRMLTRGWPVVGVDRVAPRSRRAFCAFYSLDLLSDDSIRTISEGVRKAHAHIRGLVYCAGIYPIKAFDRYTLQLWDDVNRINVRSAFHLSKCLAPCILPNGRIVFVSSAAAFLGSSDVAYSASKSALIGLTKSLAKNLAPRGILVNAVCPGPIRSQMSARMSRSSVREYIRRIPLRRFGRPDEVAVVVDFLLDPKNTYMSGASLDVSGGLALH